MDTIRAGCLVGCFFFLLSSWGGCAPSNSPSETQQESTQDATTHTEPTNTPDVIVQEGSTDNAKGVEQVVVPDTPSVDKRVRDQAPIEAPPKEQVVVPEQPPTPKTPCQVPKIEVDTSTPAQVVGNGTPQSCDEAALRKAISAGGIITFRCGAAQHTIRLQSELKVTKDTVLDGGGNINLDGNKKTRILHVASSFEKLTPKVTVQHLTFINGKTTAPANTKDTDKGGAAIYRLGGTLHIYGCTFRDNVGPVTGQDVAGGAVYAIGKGPLVIAESTFTNNRCSSGGAIGNLHNDLQLVNSVVTGNEATGSGGNPGNGGNGGGIYMDGVGNELLLCGVTLSQNKGKAFGGGVFRVSNREMPVTKIEYSSIEKNTLTEKTQGLGGGLYLQGNTVTIKASLIAHNSSRGAGGIFFGPRSSIEMENVTIAHNTATMSLGGGLSAGNDITGSFKHVTFANNAAPGAQSFAAAMTGGKLLTIKNSLFVGHTAGNKWVDLTCRETMKDGGGNIQWPKQRTSGQDDKPCTPNITFANVAVGGLKDNGGPTKTMLPSGGGGALQKGSGCAATDQRGQPRKKNGCTIGAVELP